MKESYGKDLASYPDPESCGVVRKDGSETLTGASAGEVLSHEISSPGMPTLLSEAEGNSALADKARPMRHRRGRRPSACTETSWIGTGRPQDPAPASDGEAQRVVKAARPKTTMHGSGESEQAVVAENPPNEGPRLLAWRPEEVGEPRACAKRNSRQQNIPRTQSRTHGVSSALQRVRQRAKQDKKARFTALFHHLNCESLRASFWKLKPQAAAGVDGVQWSQYAESLEPNLQDLHQRLHLGAYRAKPSRRVYIPKTDGKERPLGITALEDKIVQGAVVEVLNAVYETDFMGFSYGFRPGRSPHHALDALVMGLRRKKVNWVLDMDIRKFFDTIDHGWMERFLQHRIGDRRLLRLIGKWLKAGIMEAGQWLASEEGTPQGAVISPLLANVYLHYVLDLWSNQWRKRHAQGDVIMVRYADDAVLGFELRSDAERFQEALRERLGQFSLQLHEEKTRLIEFGRYAEEKRKRSGRDEAKANH